MKIAIVTGLFPLLSESFVLNHVTGLIEDDHDVTIFSNGIPAGKLHPDFGRYNLTARMAQPSIPSLAQRWTRAPGTAWRLGLRQTLACLSPLRNGFGAFSLKGLYTIRDIARGDFDLIHCHFGQNGLAMLGVREMTQTPVVTSFHGGDLRLFGAFGGIIYRQLFRRGDAFVANTRYTGRCLERLGCPHERIACIPTILNDVAEPRQVDILSADPVRLITVARLEAIKGIQYGLHAVRVLLDRGYRVQYTIVGDGRCRAALQRLVRELAIEPQVTFTGWLDHVEVYREYAASDVLILPSIRATPRSVEETQGMVIQEAQLHGLAVVASRVGGVPEGVDGGQVGLLFEPADASDLARQLARLLDDRAFTRRIAAAGRAYCLAHYSKRAVIGRLIDLYRTLLQDKRSSGIAAPHESPRVRL
jgi:colanic acid/amylovoran biosynthesis glycosyltransferase